MTTRGWVAGPRRSWLSAPWLALAVMLPIEAGAQTPGGDLGGSGLFTVPRPPGDIRTNNLPANNLQTPNGGVGTPTTITPIITNVPATIQNTPTQNIPTLTTPSGTTGQVALAVTA